MHEYQIHPIANIFPMMAEDEYQGLKADIAKFGQHEAITVWCNLLIDGRNRLRACNELGIEPMVCELDGTDPVGWAVSYNLHRRHLSTSQRAMVAANLATLERGANQYTNEDSSIEPPTIEQAAKTLNVSPASVKRAKHVRENASPEVVSAVESGELSLNAATKQVDAQRGTDGKPTVKHAATSALSFASMAISQMERIQDDDPHRANAFNKMRIWLDQNEVLKKRAAK